MPSTASTQQIISGLYAAFFNRAPDEAGLKYWESKASGNNDFNVFNELAAGFAEHHKFTDIYGSKDNQQFVEAIYANTLGSAGDSEGITYWKDILDSGTSRSEMVATFVYDALTIDLNGSGWDHLSAMAKDIAQNRQDTLMNKANTGVSFVEMLGDATNIKNHGDLDKDEAYQMSIDILANINSSITSVDDAINKLHDLKQSLPNILSEDELASIVNAIVSSEDLDLEGIKEADVGKYINAIESLDISREGEVVLIDVKSTYGDFFGSYEDDTLEFHQTDEGGNVIYSDTIEGLHIEEELLLIGSFYDDFANLI